MKKVLASPAVLAPFDPNLPTMLQTDASRLKGLGFALLQKHGEVWKLVQCGSRFISETESRYAMIELELLGVVWAASKCSLYLLGRQFDLVVDHKPLVPILNHYTLDMVDNPRLQRLKEKLSRFTFTTTWRKGKDHAIPDALSRAPVRDPEPADLLAEEEIAEHFTKEVGCVFSSVGREDEEAVSHEDPVLEEVRAAGEADQEYQVLIRSILDDSWSKKETS